MGCNSSNSAVNPLDSNGFGSRTLSKAPCQHRFHLRKEDLPHGTTSNNRITDFIVKNREIGQSDYKQKLEKSKLLNSAYVDVFFQATESSLGQKYQQGVQWKSPTEYLTEQPILFGEGNQIKQGRLQSNYFACAISMLSKHPEVFRRIFQNPEVNPKGIYGIWLCVDAWKCIIIDDRIPVQEGPVFTSAYNELSVPLIEKAYAKSLGDYSKLQIGLLGVCVSNLTGCPYEYFNKDFKTQIVVDEMWKFITDELGKDYMVAVSNEVYNRNQKLFGSPQYSYQVLNATVVQTKGGKTERLVNVANLWKKYDWTGKWSTSSKTWTPQLKQKLGYDEDGKSFWIGVQDLSQNFKQVCSCQYNKDYIYSFCRLKFSSEKTGFKGVFLSIDNKNSGHLTISQKDHRQFDESYKYGLVRLIVCEINKQEQVLSRCVTNHLDCTQNMSIELSLEPGTYYLAIEASWVSDSSRELVVSYYGQHGVVLLQDSDLPKDINQFINQMILLHQVHTEKQRIHKYTADPRICRTTGSLAGYIYYHYKNQSEAGRYLYETVNIKEKSNIVIQGSQGKDQFSVRVDPGQDVIVRLKVGTDANGSYSYSTKIQFYVIKGHTMAQLRDLCDKSATKTKKREMEGKTIEVLVKTYNYSGGIAILYQNKMDKYAYVQQLSLDMDNLILERQILNQKGMLDIELQPHSEKLLSFVIDKPGSKVSFRTSMSFYLNTPQFQF